MQYITYTIYIVYIYILCAFMCLLQNCSKSLAGCHLHCWDMTNNRTSRNRQDRLKLCPSQSMLMLHVSTKINQLAPGVATKASLASASCGRLWALIVHHARCNMIQTQGPGPPKPAQAAAARAFLDTIFDLEKHGLQSASPHQ